MDWPAGLSHVMIATFWQIDFWKVLIHAGLTDPMAEVQRAELHHELIEWLPFAFVIFHASAIAAGAD